MTHSVRHRRVLYIPGFDPFHPRRYRELYRKESAQQAELSGFTISQTRGDGPYMWRVSAEIEGAPVETEIEVLVWSDIVAAQMSVSIPATYAQLAQTAWIYVSSGALFRLMRLRQGPVIAALYPIVLLILQLVAALLIAWGVTVLSGYWITKVWPISPSVSAIFSILVGACAFWAVLKWFKSQDSKIFAHYLMHDYAFSARLKGAYSDEMDARLATFADRVEAALASDADEVLIVGHSSGAHIAVSVLADMLRGGRIPEERCSFLSLGHVVPMVSFLRDARRLRGDLHVMGGQDRIAWVDVTAPGDGCAFALCDPVSISGVAPEKQIGPLILSAAFSQTLLPGTWKRLRRRYFRLHFQYLCAFDNLQGAPGEYDYFRVTAGPQRLGERFKSRKSSPSAKRAPASGFRDMAR